MKKILTVCLLSLSLLGCSNQPVGNNKVQPTPETPVETQNNSVPSDIIVIFEKEDADRFKTFIESEPKIFKNVKYENNQLICEIAEKDFEDAMKKLEEVKNAN